MNLGYLLLYSAQYAAYDRGNCEIMNSLATGISNALENISRYAQAVSQANHDPLTGIQNRNGFFVEAQNLLESREDAGGLAGYGLYMIDIDDFKRINDTYGHSTGDLVLKKISEILNGI